MAFGQFHVYGIGVTLVHLVAGATPTRFIPGKNEVGYMITKNGGSGGTLAIANGFGASAANSYILGNTEHYPVNGPAQFFLCAGGATCTAAIMINYSSGYSSPVFPG
jgi:hypothetical protein